VKIACNILIGDFKNKYFPGMHVTGNKRYKVNCRIPFLHTSVTFEAGPLLPENPSYRLDFNPWKMSVNEIIALFTFLQLATDIEQYVFLAMSKVTRLDIACNLVGLELEDVIVRTSGLQKHGLYTGKGGTLETVYIGTPRSPRRVVAYTKTLEDGTKVLRLESRTKPRCLGHEIAKIKNPFARIWLISAKCAEAAGLPIPTQYIADSMRLGGLKRALRSLSKKQQTSLRKALKAANPILTDTESQWSLWQKTLIDSGLGIGLGAIPIEMFWYPALEAIPKVASHESGTHTDGHPDTQ
jgi:hypothetical protein